MIGKPPLVSFFILFSTTFTIALLIFISFVLLIYCVFSDGVLHIAANIIVDNIDAVPIINFFDFILFSLLL